MKRKEMDHAADAAAVHQQQQEKRAKLKDLEEKVKAAEKLLIECGKKLDRKAKAKANTISFLPKVEPRIMCNNYKKKPVVGSIARMWYWPITEKCHLMRWKIIKVMEMETEMKILVSRRYVDPHNGLQVEERGLFSRLALALDLTTDLWSQTEACRSRARTHSKDEWSKWRVSAPLCKVCFNFEIAKKNYPAIRASLAIGDVAIGNFHDNKSWILGETYTVRSIARNSREIYLVKGFKNYLASYDFEIYSFRKSGNWVLKGKASNVKSQKSFDFFTPLLERLTH
jgi:hypothetical protein